MTIKKDAIDGFTGGLLPTHQATETEHEWTPPETPEATDESAHTATEKSPSPMLHALML